MIRGTMRREDEEKMWVGVEKGVEKARVGQFYGTEEQYYGHIRGIYAQDEDDESVGAVGGELGLCIGH
jgi:Tfp pilus assembly protein PilP